MATPHTAVEAHTDTIYSISASLPTTYNAAGYTASSMVFTPIGKLETFPEFGADRAVTEFMPIAGDAEYVVGIAKFGSGPATMGDVPADPGQVIMAAAEVSKNHHSIEAVLPDGETYYFDVIVSTWKMSQAKSGALMLRTANISFCKRPVRIAAS